MGMTTKVVTAGRSQAAGQGPPLELMRRREWSERGQEKRARDRLNGVSAPRPEPDRVRNRGLRTRSLSRSSTKQPGAATYETAQRAACTGEVTRTKQSSVGDQVPPFAKEKSAEDVEDNTTEDEAAKYEGNRKGQRLRADKERPRQRRSGYRSWGVKAMMILVGGILRVGDIVAPGLWQTEGRGQMATRPHEAPEVKEVGIDAEPRRGVGNETGHQGRSSSARSPW